MSQITLILSLFVFVFVSLPVGATSFFAQPFEKTVTDAPIIIRGKIGKAEARFSATTDGSKQLFTFTDVELKERMKGGEGMPVSIQIREIGGEKDGVEMGVSGRAEFTMGEDVVLLLNPPAPDGSYPLRGLMMGKYNIAKDRSGNEVLTGAGISSGEHAHAAEHRDVEPIEKKEWTMKSLRALIAEGARKEKAQIQPVSSVLPSSSPTSTAASETTAQSSTPALAAPQDVDRPMPDENLKRALKFLAALVIAAGLFAWKRRNRD